jgi:hypothetical protein
MSIKYANVTTPARKHILSENPKAAIWELIFTNSSLICAKKLFNQAFSCSKPRSDIDLDASKMTNRSMLEVWQGSPVKLRFAKGVVVGGGVGRRTVGAKVGRFVGVDVVLRRHVAFGQTIPALSTQY